MDLKIKIDAAGLAAQFKEIAASVEQDIKHGVANLATITHAKVIEMASNELHSTRERFLNNLGFEEIAEGVWVVGIDESALFVEEGLEPNFDMKPGLLKDGETSGGYKYRIVPFEHSKAPSQLTPTTHSILNRIKENLKKEGIPYKKLERGADGKPRLGQLHKFSWPSELPGRGNTPLFKNVHIYQTMTKGGNVRRDILTFRTVSNKPGNEDKWLHPGLSGKKFLDRAAEWAEKEFYDKILPEILEKYGK
jgi:hypothetical protein